MTATIIPFPTARVPRTPARDPEGASAPTEAARTARQLRMLEELAEVGMGLARVAGARATGPAGTDGIAGHALDFGRVARAVRQTIALAVKLRAERRMRERDPVADAATERQLRMLQELAEIGLAVAKAPG